MPSEKLFQTAFCFGHTIRIHIHQHTADHAVGRNHMSPNTPRRAVYAGSFDPPTLGHLWMIRQAQSMFDELIVSIGINPDKRSTYTIADRRDMLHNITEMFPNVRIDVFENRFWCIMPAKCRQDSSCAAYVLLRITNTNVPCAISTATSHPKYPPYPSCRRAKLPKYPPLWLKAWSGLTAGWKPSKDMCRRPCTKK